MKRKMICGITLFLIAAVSAYAQSTAMEIETLLDTKAVTYGQAARFVLEASNAFKTSSPQEAFNYAVGQGWLQGVYSSDAGARLDKISLLLMRSFEIKGGYLYSFTKNSHYAYHELIYNNVILGRHDPSMPVSGAKLISYVSRLLAMQAQTFTEIGELK